MAEISETEIVVRGYHLDLYQHVNNARYLEFLEEARWSYLESKQTIDWLTKNAIGFVIVNINVNFRRAAVLNDRLLIQTQTSKIGNKSVVVHQDIFLKGTDTKVLDADITFVVMNLREQKILELTDEIKALFL
ncbi:acyl-CoA thioesterase [bacterium]|nr:MAG: acyl-CoA thioesterase [bacterium]